MQRNCLIIHPETAETEIAEADLVESLRVQGLIAGTFRDHGRQYYLAGERFLESIVFLGCSPQLRLSPPQGDDPAGQQEEFCHVQIEATPGRTQFLGMDNTREPICPNCGCRVTDWREMVHTWTHNPADYHWQCPGCSTRWPVAALNWRKSAGFARCALLIWGVHESEAVPAEPLLSRLRGLTGSPWRYFYARRD